MRRSVSRHFLPVENTWFIRGDCIAKSSANRRRDRRIRIAKRPRRYFRCRVEKRVPLGRHIDKPNMRPRKSGVTRMRACARPFSRISGARVSANRAKSPPEKKNGQIAVPSDENDLKRRDRKSVGNIRDAFAIPSASLSQLPRRSVADH